MSEIRLRAEGAMKALDIVAPTLAELRAAIAAKDAEIERLQGDVWDHSHSRQHAIERIAELEKALRWALGEVDDFRARKAGEGAYWWRNELRYRALLEPK